MDKNSLQNLRPVIESIAQDAALSVYNKQATKFGVAQTSVHTHNGVDSVQFPFANLSDANAYAAIQTVFLSSAQVKTLKTTPIQIVPPCNGLAVNIVESVDARLVFKGTAYTGTNALEFRYIDGSGAKVTADISTTFLNASASAYSHVAGVTTELVPVAGAQVVVCVPVADPGAGNSPITLIVKYRVVPFNS